MKRCKRLLKSKQAVAGLFLILLLSLAAVFAGIIAPNEPTRMDLAYRFTRPSAQFPLGADQFGRCILSRLIYGAQYSLGLAGVTLAVIAVTAVPAGLLSAYLGGGIDRVFGWICSVSMAFPPMVFVLAIVGVLGTGTINLILSVVVSLWGWYARLVRSFTLLEKDKGYVLAAKTAGSSSLKIMLAHILPNVFPPILVLLSMGVADVILMISGFSFLGIGIPAELPEWGAMLSESKSVLFAHPEYMAYPGVCIFLAACAFNLLGESLRDWLSPYGKGGVRDARTPAPGKRPVRNVSGL